MSLIPIKANAFDEVFLTPEEIFRVIKSAAAWFEQLPDDARLADLAGKIYVANPHHVGHVLRMLCPHEGTA